MAMATSIFGRTFQNHPANKAYPRLGSPTNQVLAFKHALDQKNYALSPPPPQSSETVIRGREAHSLPPDAAVASSLSKPVTPGETLLPTVAQSPRNTGGVMVVRTE